MVGRRFPDAISSKFLAVSSRIFRLFCWCDSSRKNTMSCEDCEHWMRSITPNSGHSGMGLGQGVVRLQKFRIRKCQNTILTIPAWRRNWEFSCRNSLLSRHFAHIIALTRGIRAFTFFLVHCRARPDLKKITVPIIFFALDLLR